MSDSDVTVKSEAGEDDRIARLEAIVAGLQARLLQAEEKEKEKEKEKEEAESGSEDEDDDDDAAFLGAMAHVSKIPVSQPVQEPGLMDHAQAFVKKHRTAVLGVSLVLSLGGSYMVWRSMRPGKKSDADSVASASA